MGPARLAPTARTLPRGHHDRGRSRAWWRLGSAHTLTIGAWSRLATIVSAMRGRHLFVIDLTAILAASYLALSLRFDGLLDYDSFIVFVPIALLPLLIRPIVNERAGLYRRAWGHASVPDLIQILWATVAGTGISLVIFFGVFVPIRATAAEGFPRSFWILEFVLSLALIGGSRFFIRACNELGIRTVIEGEPISLTPALLFGAGRAGALMARSAMREPKAGVKPVGFLDDDPARRGASVAGFRSSAGWTGSTRRSAGRAHGCCSSRCRTPPARRSEGSWIGPSTPA